jgi:hypothetical protein
MNMLRESKRTVSNLGQGVHTDDAPLRVNAKVGGNEAGDEMLDVISRR